MLGGRCLSCAISSSRDQITFTGSPELTGNLGRLARDRRVAAAALTTEAPTQKHSVHIDVPDLASARLIGSEALARRTDPVVGDQTSTRLSVTLTVALIGSIRACVSYGRWYSAEITLFLLALSARRRPDLRWNT